MEECLDDEDLAQIWRASLIKSIRVSHPDYPWYIDVSFDSGRLERLPYDNYGDPLPFPQLESFECVTSVASSTLVQSLSHFHQAAEVDIPEDDGEELNPPFLNQYFGPFHRFAFSRTPVMKDAMLWRSSLGSDQPRYVCTALAIDLCEGEPAEDCNDYYTLQHFMAAMRPLFPALSELRVKSWAFPGQWLDFTQFMEELTLQIRKWKHLQKYVFHMPFERPCHQWEALPPVVNFKLKATATDEDQFDRSRLRYIAENTVPFLDELNLPASAFCRSGPATLTTLRQGAEYSDDGSNRLPAGIRSALCLDETACLVWTKTTLSY
ncbi:hypothetical protein PHLGIDRAFT_114124 [Phlebiopsis gigantea 11061_1 CR5-6]|uniref:Uncharacterized protein n=1 Tax=Phlebiopsis gigantea (strain 11061_1 CR5-6) TaxID=745531 RepID=A0A0C3PVW8_PHLG1|nr:hypothetical protein PHLGIDRAFT_114124 [Phlebiopsis gigantea 11061_1 CR5-6]